jgi:GST-like protein
MARRATPKKAPARKPAAKKAPAKAAIDLFAWGTTNPRKVAIAMEELKLPYNLIPVDLGKKQQKSKAFTDVYAYGKIPFFVDRDGPGGKTVKFGESNAMLLYLAEKTGKLIPKSAQGRLDCIYWLFFMAGSFGIPLSIQARAKQGRLPIKGKAFDWFTDELHTGAKAMDKHLSKNRYLCGGTYTIADISFIPHIERSMGLGDLAKYRHIKRWYADVTKRPAVKKGMAVYAE